MQSDSDAPGVRWQDWSVVAGIETDRFCQGCGYNLRTQPVKREPGTQVLMCRCPECGRFHAAADSTSAARPWLQRLATLLLLTWVLIVLAAFFTCGLLDFGIGVVHFEESTFFVHRQREGADWSPFVAQLPPDRQWGRVVRPLITPERLLLVAILAAASLGAGALTGAIAAVMLHHWSHRGLIALALVIPFLALPWTLAFILDGGTHLLTFGVALALGHALLQSLGGIAGINLGRGAARLVVRMCVPPGWRGPLAFLWLVDGRKPA